MGSRPPESLYSHYRGHDCIIGTAVTQARRTPQRDGPGKRSWLEGTPGCYFRCLILQAKDPRCSFGKASAKSRASSALPTDMVPLATANTVVARDPVDEAIGAARRCAFHPGREGSLYSGFPRIVNALISLGCFVVAPVRLRDGKGGDPEIALDSEVCMDRWDHSYL